jgi:cytochrome c oxidase subunit 2
MGYLNDFLRRLLFLPPQGSEIAAKIDMLHYSVIGATMLGAFIITLVSIVFCIRYRERAVRGPAEKREAAPTPSLWTELTLIGALFGLFVTWWAWGYWQYVQLASPPADTYDVYVSGKQWMWKFAYPDGSHTINTLYVPVQKPVRLILTSRDVIHSFYVPDFRIKHDVIPGRYTSIWFSAREPGTHRVFCAEYCGTWHSRMRAQVIALSSGDFERWLHDGEKADPDDADAPEVAGSLVDRGEQVAARYGCLRCHSLDGSPHIGPTWRGLYQATVPLQDASQVVADVPYLTESMMDPNAKLHRGFGAVMPSYLGYLQPAEVGALIELIKSLRDAPSASAAPLPAAQGGLFRVPASADTAAAPRPSGAADPITSRPEPDLPNPLQPQSLRQNGTRP